MVERTGFLSEEFRKNLPWSLAWSPRIRFVWVFLYHRALALGWVWPFMFTAGAVFFTQVNGWDPLFWRSFGDTDALMIQMHAINGTWAGYSNHHFLNLAAVAAFCFGICYWFTVKQVNRFSVKQYYKFGLLSTFAAVWVWSMHEGMWWVTYIFASPLFYSVQIKPIWFSGFGEIFSISLILMTIGLGLYFPWKYVLAMGLFYVVWFAAGFPITESYIGNTSLYPDVGANLWEFASWVYACVVFFVLERTRILEWYTKVKSITLRSQVY